MEGGAGMSPRGRETAVVVLLVLLSHGQALLRDEGGWVRRCRRGPEVCSRAGEWSRVGCEAVSRGQLPQGSLSARRGWRWRVKKAAGSRGGLCGSQRRRRE